MYSYFSPLSFISHLLLIINLFISLPISFGEDDYRFLNCSRGVFECGDVKHIGYPFWGKSRAQYCGHPDFELKCEEDDTIQIVIQRQSYRVLNIFENNQTLRMRTMNPVNNNCPARLANISLPNNLFSYFAPFNQNITLFYDCPSPIPLLISYTISCLTNATINTWSYYWVDSQNIRLPGDVWSCGTVVKVPILQAIVTTYTELLQSMMDGFDVTYVVVGNNSECIQCENTRGQCGYNRGMQPTCFCSDGQYQGNCSNSRLDNSRSDSRGARKKIVIVVLTVSGTVFGGCFFGVLMLIFWWKMDLSSTNPILFWKRKKKAQMMVENYLKSFGSQTPKRYSYSAVKRITSSFKHKIGQGGFGVVYKGELLDGCVVAVKVLNKTKGNGEEFINEIASITRTSHVNVVSLFGYCFDGSKTALIYEFMANGSLEKFIYDPNSLEAQSHLGWDVLYNIAAGVARGLEYLHRGCNTRILHFDIKPHNILLDEEFCPKISDFGLAKLCPRKESIISMLGTRGTAGYIAPEVFSRNFGGVSHKSDVYSYGMMVLEIVGRRKNLNEGVNHSSEMYFPHWIYKSLELDEDIHGNMSKEEGEITRKMVLVALWCIQTNPIDRPAMSRVVEMLEGRTEFLSIPPKPYLCSPPRSLVRSSTTTL